LGLDPTQAGQAVLEKERAARELGINGVPFFIINSQLGVSGAQEAQTLLDAMGEALNEAQVA
jgi:predicted DsbA family dithiol-disulfide isomerase